MMFLYTARSARFDVLRAIGALATRITRWDHDCDRRLHRLMCYAHHSADYMMMGWIGDDPSVLSTHLFCDSDFAGCPYTLRSTAGMHLDIQGPNSRFPVSGSSIKLIPWTHSTPEAEIAAAFKAMHDKGEPMLTIGYLLFKRYHEQGWEFRMNLHEDNTTCITVARTGKNPTMKFLERGHGISIGWIHDRIEQGWYNMIHTRTEHMTADIYTKAFNEPRKWDRLRLLVNVFTPDELSSGNLCPANSDLPERISWETALSCFRRGERYLPDGFTTLADGGYSPSDSMNPQYFAILEGLSTAEDDFRKAAKVKKPKAKAKTKAKPSGNNESATAVPSKPRSVNGPGPGPLTVVLLCASADSDLIKYNPFPGDTQVIAITQEDDFLSPKGYQKALDACKRKNACIMASLPCTGGCGFNQGVNWYRGESTRAKIREHWVLFEKLWKQLERLLAELKFPIPLINEWPANNRYWSQPRVRKLMLRPKIQETRFDGCAYGLCSTRGTTMGLPIKKPRKSPLAWLRSGDSCPRLAQVKPNIQDMLRARAWTQKTLISIPL